MSKIHDKRRVFEEYKETEWHFEWVRNPAYSFQQHQQFAQNGWPYQIPEYIQVEKPKTVINKKSHIEYLIECAYCGTKAWRRKRTAKYCNGGCRKLANL